MCWSTHLKHPTNLHTPTPALFSQIHTHPKHTLDHSCFSAPLPSRNYARFPKQMLFLPALLLTLTGGGYAHAVAPAYGKAWTAASLPWLIFLLLVCLRLDGEGGDSSPAFGRMRWLGVFFPLWILLCMIIAAHHVLPLVWDVEGCPEPANLPPWLIRLGGVIKGRQSAMESRIREAMKKKKQALFKEDGGGRGDAAALVVKKEDGREEENRDHEGGEGAGGEETNEKNA